MLRGSLQSSICRYAGIHSGLGLALQGGGSHGAYTWGVLDRFLEEPVMQNIAALSGTSAGAMNAVVCVNGLLRGGPDGAREELDSFWRNVAQKAAAASVAPGLWETMLGEEGFELGSGMNRLLALSQVFSPYELNPLNLNPLREIIESQIDFDLIRRSSYPRLYVTATRVNTGTPRIFGNEELGTDPLLASACLPTLHHAVQIDGEPYWDGGYTGNPVVYPLVEHARCADVFLVLISPLQRITTVRTTKDILARASEISFNAGFLREMQWLAKRQGRGLSRFLGRCTRFHLSTPDASLSALAQSSKLNADWEFLQKLKQQGRLAAESWLSDHQQAIGKRSSVNLAKAFGTA